MAAIAEKSLKEVTYHVRWSSDWVIRLGDGTEESKKRMKKAISELWPYTGEMVVPAAFESNLENRVCIDVSSIKDDWFKKIKTILEEATIDFPDPFFYFFC